MPADSREGVRIQWRRPLHTPPSPGPEPLLFHPSPSRNQYKPSHLQYNLLPLGASLTPTSDWSVTDQHQWGHRPPSRHSQQAPMVAWTCFMAHLQHLWLAEQLLHWQSANTVLHFSMLELEKTGDYSGSLSYMDLPSVDLFYSGWQRSHLKSSRDLLEPSNEKFQFSLNQKIHLEGSGWPSASHEQNPHRSQGTTSMENIVLCIQTIGLDPKNHRRKFATTSVLQMLKNLFSNIIRSSIAVLVLLRLHNQNNIFGFSC